MEPESTGVGGDLFAQVYMAGDKKLYGLNASGWAPAGWTRSYFTSRGLTEIPYTGVDSATVPGAIDGWAKLLDRFGTMKFKQVLEPAIRDADQGFPLSERIHTDWRTGVNLLRRDPDSAAVYLRDNQAPPLYSIVRNPDLANTFRVLQKKGRDAFYKGEIAKAIVAKVRALGGVMSLVGPERVRVGVGRADLDQLPRLRRLPAAAQRAGRRRARDAQHPRGLRAEARDEPGAARAALAAVLAPADRGQEARVHRPRQVRRRPALRRRPGRAADLEGVRGDAVRRRSILATPRQPGVSLDREGGTVYIATADRWGNMVSFIYSVYDVFGSGVTIPGYGFLLHNRGALFTLDSTLAERRLAAQAAVPHDHPGVRDEGRPARDGLREHGRERPGPSAGDRAGEHDRSRARTCRRRVTRPASGTTRSPTGRQMEAKLYRPRRAAADRDGPLAAARATAR